MLNKFKPTKGDPMDPSKVDSVEGGIISMLFRTIVKDLKVGHMLPFLAKKAEEAEAKSANNKDESKVSRVRSKSQIYAQAASSKMTWKIFMRLLKTLLGVVSIQVSITIERANGSKTTHHTPVVFVANETKLENDEEDSDEE